MKTAILVELINVLDDSDATVTLYWSNTGYVTQSADTPSNQYYDPCITSDIITNEKISIDSTPNISFSDLTISNKDKSAYLNYTWKGRTVNIYHGEVNQARSAFTLIYTGIIDNLVGDGYDSYKLTMSDKLEDLNKPITETKLGGVTENTDEILPLCFGEVANIQPLLIDPALHKYQVHQEAIEDLLEVRDYGYPITVTKDNANGKFTLTASPAGTITCSVQGDKRSVYNVTIADIITEIVKQYGGFTDSDINTTNFSTFDAAHTQQVSYYVTSNENILTVIQYLADAIEAQVYTDRLGELNLFQLTLNDTSTLTITDSDIKEHSIYLERLLPVKAGIKLQYCENHTPQPDLQTGIVEEHKDLWAKDYLTVSSTDSTTATKYNLETEVEPVKSALINKTEAQAESDRRLALWKVQRYLYQAELFRTDLELGQTITYDSNDYVVLGLETNWTQGTSKIEVVR